MLVPLFCQLETAGCDNEVADSLDRHYQLGDFRERLKDLSEASQHAVVKCRLLDCLALFKR